MNVTKFAGDSYWMYDGSESTKAPTINFKPTKNWGGVEGPIDDVLYRMSGFIYFLTKHAHYRYNCEKSLVRSNDTNCAVRKLNNYLCKISPKYGKIIDYTTLAIL
jgi:hypothetical protein